MIIHSVHRRRLIARLAALVLLCDLPGFVDTARPQDAAPANTQPVSMAPNNVSRESSLSNGFPMRVVSPGVFEIGDVKMNTLERTVCFSARLNPVLLNTNPVPMEYLLVTRYGKTHESLLVTGTDPYLIHVGMLLLGATSAGTNDVTSPPSAQISSPSGEAMPGDEITLEVSWQAEGGEIRRPAEKLAFNTQTKTNLAGGRWVYNGSVVWDKHFLAQRDGSIVSLVTDPIALVNSTGAGHDNDHIWMASTNSLPPAGAPLQVTIKLIPKTAKKQGRNPSTRDVGQTMTQSGK